MPRVGPVEYYLHPEGKYPAEIVSCDLAENNQYPQYGPQLQWTFQTNLTQPDGRPATVRYYTPAGVSARNKLGQMFIALGLPLPGEGEEFDTDDLIRHNDAPGRKCTLKIVHNEKPGQPPRAVIDAVLEYAKTAGSKKPAESQASPPAPADGNIIDAAYTTEEVEAPALLPAGGAAKKKDPFDGE